MAKLKNVKFRTGRFYTIVFTSDVLAFVEYLYLKEEILYFKVIGSTYREDEMLEIGKVVNARKKDLNRGGVRIRNMSNTEIILYGKKN